VAPTHTTGLFDAEIALLSKCMTQWEELWSSSTKLENVYVHASYEAWPFDSLSLESWIRLTISKMCTYIIWCLFWCQYHIYPQINFTSTRLNTHARTHTRTHINTSIRVPLFLCLRLCLFPFIQFLWRSTVTHTHAPTHSMKGEVSARLNHEQVAEDNLKRDQERKESRCVPVFFLIDFPYSVLPLWNNKVARYTLVN
jgi:hypothetical protein